MTSGRHVYDDGGRKAAGYTGKVGDCTTRAIAIATGVPYRDVLGAQAARVLATGDPNANARVNTDAVLVGLGWHYVKATRTPAGPVNVSHSDGRREVRQTHRWPRVNEVVPSVGRYVVNMHGHMAAVIDGVVRDLWDSRNKPVYGYWTAGGV